MKTIEYSILYSGKLNRGGYVTGAPEAEMTQVRARDVNSGFTEALRRAKQKLGNGDRREIFAVSFSRIVR